MVRGGIQSRYFFTPAGIYVPDPALATSGHVLKNNNGVAEWMDIGEEPPGVGDLVLDSSGKLYYDDFNRANAALAGSFGWLITTSPTTDAGTNWNIVSNKANSASGANNDRIHTEFDAAMKLKNMIV